MSRISLKKISDSALSKMIANGSASFFVVDMSGSVRVSTDGMTANNGEHFFTNNIAFYKKLLKEQKKRKAPMCIIQKLKDNGQFETALDDIRSWHSDCEQGQDGECAIYDAIQVGKSDEEILLIAYEVDTELVEKYLDKVS